MDVFSQFMSEHGWMCFANEMRGDGGGLGGYYSIILRYHEPSWYVYFTRYIERLFIIFLEFESNIVG